MKMFIKSKRTSGRILLLLMGVFLAVALVLSSGCTNGNTQEEPTPNLNQPEESTKVTLYFSDSQAAKLIPEEREVAVNEGSLPEAAVNELIKGPQNPELSKTIPDGTELISVVVKDGIAQVDFSNEFQANHWGGSAGETITIYSVVNTLTKLDGIEEVQFLIEGEKIESLAGHLDLTMPVASDETMISEN